VDRLVWNAARRLAYLVFGALALVGVLLVRDALSRRAVLLADVFAAAATSLALGALVAMAHARRFFARAQGPTRPRSGPYREGLEGLTDDPGEPQRARATRSAAAALLALAVAGALMLVAAASR
jgi:hypothetical protein